jgi:hypothetical protein
MVKHVVISATARLWNTKALQTFLACALAIAVVPCASCDAADEPKPDSATETTGAATEAPEESADKETPGVVRGTGTASMPEVQKAARESRASVELTCGLLDDIASTPDLQVFSLSEEPAPALETKTYDNLTKAMQAIQSKGDLGFFMMDVESGAGIAYNLDEPFYGASSFKGPYAVFLCQELIETGKVKLDDECKICTRVDKLGSYPFGGSDTVQNLIYAAVVESDNNAYVSLRDTFDTLGYDEWATGLGVKDCPWTQGFHYPTYCTRSSAKLWLNTYRYFETGSDTSVWLEAVMQIAEDSFIREALKGTDAVVADKGGWIASDDEPEYNVLVDAGLIEYEGRTYIMCVMAGLPDCEEYRALCSDLAAALFATHESLSWK